MSIRGKLFAVALLSLSPIALLIVVTYHGLSDQLEASHRVRASLEVIAAARQVGDHLVEMLGAVSTYALFRRTSSVSALNHAYAAFLNDIVVLQSHIRDSPAQVERVETMSAGVVAWRRGPAARLIEAVSRGQRDEALRLVDASDAFARVLRGQAERLIQVEEVLLAQRTMTHAEAQRRTILFLVAGGLTAVGAGMGAAVVLGLKITRPLGALRSAAEAVAAGDLTRRVAIESRDEVGVLGATFNTMIDEVTKRRDAVERSRREAESLLGIARVVGGTNDLGEALRLVCRELCRLSGADTAAVYGRDPGGVELRPLAGYHVPTDVLQALIGVPIPLDEEQFRDGVLDRGQAVWSDDVQNDPRFSLPVFRQFPHRSSLILPLALDNLVSGVFYLVWWDVARRFEEPEIATLQAVGQQVGILLRNARLYEAAESRAARLRTLAFVDQLVSSSLEIDEVLHGIARAAAELMGAPVVSFWLADEREQTLAVRAVSDMADGGGYPARSQRFGEGGVGWVAQHRRPLNVANVAEDARFADGEWHRRTDLRSFLAVPVSLDGTLLAVLALSGPRPFQLGPDDQELLDAFVIQAAIALRNARLYAESSRQAKRLETLVRLTRTITASLDPDAVLPEVAGAALSLFPGGACRVWIVEAGVVRLAAGAGIRGTSGADTRREMPLGEGLVGAVCRTGRPIIFDDLYTFPDLKNADWMRTEGFESTACLPLVVGITVVGAFVLFTRERHVFDRAEMTVLQALAEQAAVVLEKARLFKDVQARQRLTEDLYALTVWMQRSVALHERVEAFVRLAAGALGFDRVNVLLATADSGALELVAGTDLSATVPRIPLRSGGGAYASVWETGKTLVVSTDADLAALPLAPEARSHPAFSARRFALVPLKSQGRSIGVVSADNEPSRRAITRASVVHLELFAQQLAQSVNTARLHAESQRRERETAILFEATRRLAATLDFDTVLDIVIDSTMEALQCDAAGIFRWDGARDGLVALRDQKLSRALTRELVLRSSEGVAGRAYAERRPVWTHDCLADPRVLYTDANRELVRAGTTRACLAVPIEIRDEIFGVLTANHVESHEYGEHEVSLLANLAAQAAVALENARLYAETQQHLAGAALLNDAARTLHRTLDVRRGLPDAVAELGRTFGAVGAAVTISGDAESEKPQVIAWGAGTETVAEAAVSLLRQRDDPLMIADVATTADPRLVEILTGAARSVAAFPVRGRSRVVGTLLLLFRTRRALSAVETRLLSAYADQLAMALDNAALFENAENQRVQLERIFASTSDGILFLDQAGRIAALNPRGAELFGIAPAEVVGRPFGDLVDRLGDRVRWEEWGARALTAVALGPPRDEVADLQVRLPQARTLRWQATPTRDRLGETVGLTLTVRDVTREREVDRMKTEFVSTVSHELRTPLTSIKGSLHLLRGDGAAATPLDETQQELVGICLKNTDRLVRLINDILDVSKIEAGRIQLQLARHRVGEFVTTAVEGIRAVAEAHGVVLEARVADDLPHLHVDLDRVVQVVTNLLSNAIKFSPPGGRVIVTAGAVATGVEVRVTDQGRGIAAEDIPKLFRKFQQLDGSTVREVGGTGLGLAICRGIVEEHGGSIRAESEPDRGATFIITLPVATVEKPVTDGALPAVRDIPVGEGAAPEILVVDHDVEACAVLTGMLAQGGFRVTSAPDGAAALTRIVERCPALVLLGAETPGAGGHELLRTLRADPSTHELPVIILTGEGGREPATAGALGATELRKPFSTRELLETIRSCASRREAAR
jgi:PAS domain S-box-containing protein